MKSMLTGVMTAILLAACGGESGNGNNTAANPYFVSDQALAWNWTHTYHGPGFWGTTFAPEGKALENGVWLNANGEFTPLVNNQRSMVTRVRATSAAGAWAVGEQFCHANFDIVWSEITGFSPQERFLATITTAEDTCGLSPQGTVTSEILIKGDNTPNNHALFKSWTQINSPDEAAPTTPFYMAGPLKQSVTCDPSEASLNGTVCELLCEVPSAVASSPGLASSCF